MDRVNWPRTSAGELVLSWFLPARYRDGVTYKTKILDINVYLHVYTHKYNIKQCK